MDGAGVEEAALHAWDLAAAEGLTFVHPFDDNAVIAGQGTLALEMLDAAPELDVLVVPLGGGGLIGGIATAAKARKPGIEVVGVGQRATGEEVAHDATDEVDALAGGLEEVGGHRWR